MTKEAKNEIIRSFRNGANIKVIKELNPSLTRSEIEKELRDAGWLGEDGNHIGVSIGKLRSKLKMTQKKLSELSGVCAASVSKIESKQLAGESALILLKTLRELEAKPKKAETCENPVKSSQISQDKIDDAVAQEVAGEMASGIEIPENDNPAPENEPSVQESGTESLDDEILFPNNELEHRNALPKVMKNIIGGKIKGIRASKDLLELSLKAMELQIKELEDFINA